MNQNSHSLESPCGGSGVIWVEDEDGHVFKRPPPNNGTFHSIAPGMPDYRICDNGDVVWSANHANLGKAKPVVDTFVEPKYRPELHGVLQSIHFMLRLFLHHCLYLRN